jgi:1,4-dihydroxy-2-naphthoate polyprenyltransferase
VGYITLLAIAFGAMIVIGLVRPWALLGLVAAPFAVPPGRIVLGGGRGPALIAALQGTGLLTLLAGVMLGTGLALSG